MAEMRGVKEIEAHPTQEYVVLSRRKTVGVKVSDLLAGKQRSDATLQPRQPRALEFEAYPRSKSDLVRSCPMHGL